MRDILLTSVGLLLAPTFVTHAQDVCNAPAKEPLVQLEVPGRPFEPVVSADGCWIFVTITAGGDANGGQVAVVRRSSGALSVARAVSVKGNPTGAVLTHDGKLLVVASGGYLAFLDATRLESGQGDPVLGYIANGSAVGCRAAVRCYQLSGPHQKHSDCEPDFCIAWPAESATKQRAE